ncbi:site-specific integrase [Pelomonas sp. P7]|uniref:Site-specific integrase n=1 Tax=Pelomonas caseinilytica TaxID=2906763 RepID=A0ABS8XMF2_9BURK|nr:site-specific integrase [Pelomonas sp. P7]MCE4540787.1 site-specific integrase [Pelomonas sp. P7]
MAYRRSLELSDLPVHGEPSPLLFPVAWRRSKHPAPEWPEQMTRSAVHGVVKAVFAVAAQRWLRAGRGQEQADRLKAASAHWLRHTAGSNLANDVDLRHVRDTLGHTTLSTTSIYVHGEDDARHNAVSAAHRISW